MRLIDADALKRALLSLFRYPEEDEFYEICCLIDNQPSVYVLSDKLTDEIEMFFRESLTEIGGNNETN